MPDGTTSSPLDPERSGPFFFLRMLGAGAMGSVHLVELAEDMPYAPAGTRVALKQLHPSLTGHPKARDRFLREGRIGLSVRHPCVVRTLDVDIIPVDGVEMPVLVLEYVEGRSLDAVIRQMRSVPEALLRHLGAQLARPRGDSRRRRRAP